MDCSPGALCAPLIYCAAMPRGPGNDGVLFTFDE
jgi:hypothetical protein